MTAIAVLPAQNGHAQSFSDSSETVARKVTRVDAELANSCVLSGRSKTECVCVARIIRETVDAHDFEPTARLQAAEFLDTQTAAKLGLARSGISESEIVALEAQRRRIVRTRVEPVCLPGPAPLATGNDSGQAI